MSRLAVRLQTFVRAQREKGASAVEYGLLIALIAAVIIAIVFVLGHQVSNTFSSMANAL